MKKYLYGTTALVAATLMAGAVNAAEPLKVGVSGNMQQWFGIVSHEDDGIAGPSDTTAAAGGTHREVSNFGINTDTEVDFKAKTTLDNGMEVEARVELDTNNNAVAVAVDEEWVSVGGKWGKLYAGQKESSNWQLHNEAVDYGIGISDVDMWIVEPAEMGGAGHTPGTGGSSVSSLWEGTSMADVLGNASDIPSIQYISPKLFGFQAATTYSPAPGQLGAINTPTTATSALAGAVAPARDYWDATLAYSAEFSGVTIGADTGYGRFTGASNGAGGAGAPASARIWNAGAKVGYNGFTLGGGFMRYMEPSKNNELDIYQRDGRSWNAGLAYANGPWGVSVAYYNEDHQATYLDNVSAVATPDDETFETWLFSGKYTLGPGVDLKASVFVAQYDDELATDIANSEAFGLVSGLDVNF